MNRTSCLCWSVVALLVNLAIVRGDEARKPPIDLYGDPLPPGAVARLGTIRLRHAHAALVFSKDGKQLISCGDNGEVRVWDAATGKRLRRARLERKPEDGNLWTMVLSPDGATAAAWHIDSVTLYDARTGKQRGRLPGAPILRHPLLAYSPDGKLLITQDQDADKHAIPQIWDVVAVKKRCVLGGPSPVELRRAIFSPDGKRVVGREDIGSTLHVWDAKTGVEIPKGKRLAFSPAELAFSPDGATLAVGGLAGGGVHLLDGATLEEKRQLPMPAGMQVGHIDGLAFSPDGRWLAAAHSQSKGACDGRGVLIWDMKGSQPARCLPGWLETHFAFAPDSKTLAYDDYGTIHLVDPASGRELISPHRGHKGLPHSLAVSPNGKFLASASSDEMYLWDVAAGKPLRRLTACDRWAACCFFSPDGRRLIAAGFNGTIQVWDVASGKEERRLACYPTTDDAVRFYAAGISSDGERLLVIADSLGKAPREPELMIWKLSTGQRITQRPYAVETWRTGPAETDWTRMEPHAAFTPDGGILTEWRNDRVNLEESASGSLLATLPAGRRGPLVFSPDGRLLAATLSQRSKSLMEENHRRGLSLVETLTGEEVLRLDTGSFKHVAFLPEGHGIITANEKALSVWDVDTGKRLHQLPWPESVQDHRGETSIFSLAVLPGSRVATGMQEGDILIWDLASSTWPRRQHAAVLDRERLAALWADLAGDAHKAHHALVALSAAPAHSLPWLNTHLQPLTVDDKRIEQLLANLDAAQFEVREAASRELTARRYRIEPRLRRALDNQPSLEVRRRLQAILAGPKRPSAESVRLLRAIAVLERIGTGEARRILDKLAGGTASPETTAAEAALQRLKQREAGAEKRSSP